MEREPSSKFGRHYGHGNDCYNCDHHIPKSPKVDFRQYFIGPMEYHLHLWRKYNSTKHLRCGRRVVHLVEGGTMKPTIEELGR